MTLIAPRLRHFERLKPMHVIFRETQGLEETETPMDLGQTPADLVVLSFSDSDLGAFAQAWREGRDNCQRLRLANLVALNIPLRWIHMLNKR